MAAVIDQLRAEGRTVNEEDIARLSPARYEHINPYGKYRFEVEEGLAAPRRGRSADSLNIIPVKIVVFSPSLSEPRRGYEEWPARSHVPGRASAALTHGRPSRRFPSLLATKDGSEPGEPTRAGRGPLGSEGNGWLGSQPWHGSPGQAFPLARPRRPRGA